LRFRNQVLAFCLHRDFHDFPHSPSGVGPSIFPGASTP
jgi:hypothetical protein